MKSIVKSHPVATIIYVLYILCWVWLYYIAYNDYNNHGDGETIGMSLFGFLLIFFLPYLIIALLGAGFSKKSSEFYWRLSLLILAPLPFVAVAFFVIRTNFS